MNGLGELVQVIGLAGLTVAGLIVGWVVAARLKSAVAEVVGLDVSASFEADEDGR